MSPHGMPPGLVGQVTPTGCLIVGGSWKRGAIPEGYKWNEYFRRASQTAPSSDSIPLDETYAENPSARTPSFQLSGEENVQTNAEHEQDLLERI